MDQATTLWTSKTGLQGGLGGKRSCALWMSESLVLLQLDPLDHHFDPEGQAPTLWDVCYQHLRKWNRSRGLRNYCTGDER